MTETRSWGVTLVGDLDQELVRELSGAGIGWAPPEPEELVGAGVSLLPEGDRQTAIVAAQSGDEAIDLLLPLLEGSDVTIADEPPELLED